MSIITCASCTCNVDTDFHESFVVQGAEFCASCYEDGFEELEARGWQYDRLILEDYMGFDK